MKLKLALFLLMILLAVSCGKQTPISSSSKKVDSLLSVMTIEEKIGQLNLPSAGAFTTGQAENSDIGKKIEKGQVGGLFNIKGIANIREMQKIAVEKSRLKIPLL